MSAQPSLSTLIDQLTHGDANARRGAAEKLSRMAEAAQGAIPALVHTVADVDEETRELATAALEDVGPPSGDQIGELARLAQAADESIAYWAVTMLGRAGAIASGTVAVLMNRLQDRSAPTVQQRAAWALGEIARFAPQALAALEQAASAEGPVAAHARAALQRARAA